MFFIKIKLKGYLKNITTNKIEKIETKAIKKDNVISFIYDDINHRITIKDEKIILSRNNNKFSHELIFELKKEHNTEYYIKELNTSIYIKIKTTKISITDNKIEIYYKVLDSNEEYLYLIEMSD